MSAVLKITSEKKDGRVVNGIGIHPNVNKARLVLTNQRAVRVMSNDTFATSYILKPLDDEVCALAVIIDQQVYDLNLDELELPVQEEMGVLA